MTDQPEKRPRGRQKGWLKKDGKSIQLTLRITEEMETWLSEEGDKRAVSAGVMARGILKKAMDAAKRAAEVPDDDDSK